MATGPKSDRAKKRALDAALGAMFGKLKARPVPDRLMSVVDQLEEQAESKPLKKTGAA